MEEGAGDRARRGSSNLDDGYFRAQDAIHSPAPGPRALPHLLALPGVRSFAPALSAIHRREGWLRLLDAIEDSGFLDRSRMLGASEQPRGWDRMGAVSQRKKRNRSETLTIEDVVVVVTMDREEFISNVMAQRMPPDIFLRAYGNEECRKSANEWLEKNGYFLKQYPDRLEILHNEEVIGEWLSPLHFHSPPHSPPVIDSDPLWS